MVWLLVFGVSAIDKTGKCGDNAYWIFDESTGVLTVSGEGRCSLKPLELNWDEYDYFERMTEYSKVKKFLFNEGITHILRGDSYPQVEEISLPDSLLSIDSGLINDMCNLKEIYFPENVYIDIDHSDSYFYWAWSLEKIVIDEDNPYYSSEGGVLFNKDKTELLAYLCGKRDDVYFVPDSVKSISDRSFGGNRFLKKLYLEKM